MPLPSQRTPYEIGASGTDLAQLSHRPQDTGSGPGITVSYGEGPGADGRAATRSVCYSPDCGCAETCQGLSLSWPVLRPGVLILLAVLAFTLWLVGGYLARLGWS